MVIPRNSESKAELRTQFRLQTRLPEEADEVCLLSHVQSVVAAWHATCVGAYVPICDQRAHEPTLPFCCLQEVGVACLAWPCFADDNTMQYRMGSDPLPDLEATTRWSKGRFGLPEASGPVVEPELVLVPGLAFDRRGYRLGQGKGCFDHYLQKHDIPAVGIAWSWQLLDIVPNDPWDRPVDTLITEKEIVWQHSPPGRPGLD